MCISFEELASVLVEAGKSKICRGVQQAGDQWKSCGFESKNGLMVEFIFPLERLYLFWVMHKIIAFLKRDFSGNSVALKKTGVGM